jgi:hypothetical protein
MLALLATAALVALTFTDPAITESSGLVVDASSGLVVTTNDSGDTGRVFAVDPVTGDTVGTTTWSDDPVDVEALAPAGPGEVWVADIGDNDAVRPSVVVARVPVGRGDRTVEPLARHELVYPDGPRDAESLLVDPQGRLLVVTKGLLGGQVLRTVGPLDPDGPTRLGVVGVTLPIATDAAFLPDGRHLVVRSYGSAVVHAYPSLEEVGSFALPAQEQGEGLAVDGAGALLLSTEGAGSAVLRVRLPGDVRRAIAPPEREPDLPEEAADRSPEQPSEDGAQPLPWRWAVGGAVGLLATLLLVRTLRPAGEGRSRPRLLR